MIVDCHTHIFEAGSGGPFNLPSSTDDLVRAMDTYGIDVSIVLPLPGVASNEFVQRECARHAGRLTALYYPEFDAVNGTLRKMEAFFGCYSPKGLKIHPRNQGVTVNEGRVVDVLHWAAEGVDATRRLPGVEEILLEFSVGDLLQEPEDDRSGPGFALVLERHDKKC